MCNYSASLHGYGRSCVVLTAPTGLWLQFKSPRDQWPTTVTVVVQTGNGRRGSVYWVPTQTSFVTTASRVTCSYSFSHNHGSRKWLSLKGKYYWRDPFFTSMWEEGYFTRLLRRNPEAISFHFVTWMPFLKIETWQTEHERTIIFKPNSSWFCGQNNTTLSSLLWQLNK